VFYFFSNCIYIKICSFVCQLLFCSPTYLFVDLLFLTVMLLPIFRFSEKGKIFAKQEIRAIQTGPGGLFFTGDGTGQVRVWNSVAVPTATT
jgi:hypothetical protein